MRSQRTAALAKAEALLSAHPEVATDGVPARLNGELTTLRSTLVPHHRVPESNGVARKRMARVT